MNLHETKIAKEYLDTAVARLKDLVEKIAGSPEVDHKPPVTAVRWEKLSGPEMNAITQLLRGASFIIKNPPKEQSITDQLDKAILNLTYTVKAEYRERDVLEELDKLKRCEKALAILQGKEDA